MTPETHPFEQEIVMAYLDGELAPEQAARVATHLEQCAGCRELVGDLCRVSSQLQEWSVERPSAKLNDAVLAAVNSSESNGAIRLTPGNTKSRLGWINFIKGIRSKWAWAAASLAAIVLGGFLFEWFLHVPASAPRMPAEVEEFAKLQSTNVNKGRLQIQGELAPTTPAGPSPAPQADLPPTAPMIARTASLNVSAKDFDSARAAMERVVKSHRGYIASLNVTSEQGAPRSLNAKLAVPAEQFDAALADLRALGRVGQEQQSSEEVTAQAVDLEARLKNARETEDQLGGILRTRTGKVGDVLEVEREIARVRGEIESMEAEQKNLRARVDFASIELNLAEEYRAELGGIPMSTVRRIRNALVDGYRAAEDGFLAVCIFLLNIGPSLLLIALTLILPVRWAWRRWRKSRGQPVSA